MTDAARVLERGADKISINSPSIARPELIKELHDEFGKQCVVVGIDSFFDETTCEYLVYQLTGDPNASSRNGYDNEQLSKIRQLCDTSLIASGGAGSMQHAACKILLMYFNKAKWMVRSQPVFFTKT